MEPKQSPSVSARSSREIPVEKPRWAFSKGVLVGAAIEVPAVSFGVWVAQNLGLVDPDVGFLRIMWLTAIFAGIAAVFTAGGIGRLAAQVVVDRGRGRALFQAARAHAIAGAGLVLIATIPHGHLPMERSGWIEIAAIGLVPGAVCGLAIGFICSSATPVGLADVWSLTVSRPSGAIRQLLDPRDLVKLGKAIGTRTSTLFDGIFDPAPKPPQKPDDKPAEKPPATPPTTPATPVNDKPPEAKSDGAG